MSTTEFKEIPKTEKKVYRHSMPSAKMFLKDGTPIIFVNHRFITDDPEKQAELDKEVARKHPNLTYEDYHSDMDNPMAALRKQIIEAEAEAIAAAAHNKLRDMGNSNHGNLNVQSTTDLAPVAAGNGPGNSPALARLNALTQKK